MPQVQTSSINSGYKKQVLWPLLMAIGMLALAISSLLYIANELIQTDAQEVRIDDLRYDLLQLENNIIDAEAGQRGYLLTANTTFLAPYEQASKDFPFLILSIRQKLKAFSHLEYNFSHIEQLCTSKFRIIEDTILVQQRAGTYASHLAIAKDNGKIIMDDLRYQFKLIDDILNNELYDIKFQTKLRYKQVKIGALVLLFVIISILIFTYYHTLDLFDRAANAREVFIKMRHEAEHDSLTKIANRRRFDQELEDTFNEALAHGDEFTILYLDLDGFKEVNDSLGHDVGDAALTTAARRFKRVLREHEFIARLGGDEFAIIVHRYQNKKDLVKLANRLVKALKTKISLGSHKIQLGVSIGIASYPDNASNKEALLNAADEAMYTAKKTGRSHAFSNQVV